MAKGSGWNVGNIHTLRDSIEAVIDKHGQDQQRVIQAIAAWWDADENALPRGTTMTINEQSELFARKLAAMGNRSEWANAVRAELAGAGAFAPIDLDFIGTVLAEAPTSSPAWDGLKAWARIELAQGRSLPLEVQRILIDQARPKRKQHGSVAHQVTRQQVAAIISVLREKTIFKSTSKNDLHSSPASSAFVMVEQASRCQVTKDAAADMWKAEKVNFGAK